MRHPSAHPVHQIVKTTQTVTNMLYKVSLFTLYIAIPVYYY